MANHTSCWTLANSSIRCDSNGTTLQQHSGESLLSKESPHCEGGLITETARKDDGILHVTIHEAKHIHNLCIYGNQDVYAKFLLTHSQDAVYPTRPVKAGDQNPVFNESLEIPLTGHDSILRCELWMMSCARNYMEDQLLGFVLVPLKALYGQGKQSLEYCLTSTDFFYTPAGTVHLSLCISDRNSVTSGELSPQTEVKTCPCPPCCAFPQVINCGGKSATQANMSKVEFLDLEAGAEDPHLVSIYYKMANGTSFEEEKESRNSVDYSSHAQCPNEQGNAHLSLPGEVHSASPKANDTSVDVSQIQVHVSLAGSVDDDDMADGKMKYNAMHAPLYFPALEDLSQVKEISNNIIRASDTDGVQAPSAAACVNKQFREIATEVTHEAVALNSAEVVSTCQTDRLVLSGNIPHGMGMAEPDRNVKQEHFVDLYLKSLQQFKDKVADMNFSLDINAQDLAALRSVQVDSKVLEMRRKEGYRLYYGSRAFY